MLLHEFIREGSADFFNANVVVNVGCELRAFCVYNFWCHRRRWVLSLCVKQYANWGDSFHWREREKENFCISVTSASSYTHRQPWSVHSFRRHSTYSYDFCLPWTLMKKEYNEWKIVDKKLSLFTHSSHHLIPMEKFFQSLSLAILSALVTFLWFLFSHFPPTI